MAIYYCDLYSGNDSNDGLTTATPKLTIANVCTLVTTFGDEIRVRGVDSVLGNSLGNGTWTQNSFDVTFPGDITSSISVGDYFYKSTEASPPNLYKVGAVSYSDPTTTITITTANDAVGGEYLGDSETVSCYVLLNSDVTGHTVAPLALGVNGKYSGAGYSFDRIDTSISGGWNSDYTVQDSYTICYNTSLTAYCFASNNFNGNRSYWSWSKFISIGYRYGIYKSYYSHVTDCFFGWNGYHTSYFTYNYSVWRNVIFADCANILARSMLNVKSINCLFRNTPVNNINCSGPCVFENCKIYSIGTECVELNNSIFINGDIRCKNDNQSVFYNSVNGAYIKDCSVGYFPDSPSDELYLFNTVSYSNNGVGMSIMENIYPYSTNDGKFSIWNNVSGNICLTNPDVSIAVKGTSFGGLNLTSDKIDLSNYSNYAFVPTGSNWAYINEFLQDIDTSAYTYAPFLKSYVTSNDGTKILYGTGIGEITNNAYDGSTAFKYTSTGTIQYAQCAGTFDPIMFKIKKDTEYDLSFYIKGNTTYTLYYNIFNGGRAIWKAWKPISVTTTYTEKSTTISVSDWNNDGDAALVFEWSNSSRDEFYLDKISLT